MPQTPGTLHKLWSSSFALRRKPDTEGTPIVQKGYTPKMASRTPKTPATPLPKNLRTPLNLPGMLTRLAKQKLANPTPRTILKNQPRVSITRIPVAVNRTGLQEGGAKTTCTPIRKVQAHVWGPAEAQQGTPTTDVRATTGDAGAERQGPSRVAKTDAMSRLRPRNLVVPKIQTGANGTLLKLRAGVRGNRPGYGGVLHYLQELLGESKLQKQNNEPNSSKGVEQVLAGESARTTEDTAQVHRPLKISIQPQKHFLPVDTSGEGLLMIPEKVYAASTVTKVAKRRRQKFGAKLGHVMATSLAPISETSESQDFKSTASTAVQTSLSVPPVPRVFKSEWTEPIPSACKYTALRFRVGRLPESGQPLTADGKIYPEHQDIVVLFSSLERVQKLIGKSPARREGTVEGPPQVGDARRMYNKPEQRYTTSLIVTKKQVPLEMANLELALWNLHTQAIGLEAKRIHIPVDQKITRAMKPQEILMAIDRQFLESEYEVHIWHQTDLGTQRESNEKTRVM